VEVLLTWFIVARVVSVKPGTHQVDLSPHDRDLDTGD
jgi:hypothetical protein